VIKKTKTTMSSEEVESTTFLGVKIDTINGPTDPRIKKALERSASLLDILKFIKVVKFKLNMTMFDYFSTDGPKVHPCDMLAFRPTWSGRSWLETSVVSKKKK